MRKWKNAALIVAPLAAVAVLGPALAAAVPAAASAGPSTSLPGVRAAAAPRDAAQPGDTVITFSEFTVGTSISDQYQDKGIDFGGDSPFITTDGANPTSPVLSGTPLFSGTIDGRFVRPDGSQRTVGHFSLDVGYIDDPGSVEITAFSTAGAVVAQTLASQVGIDSITLTAHGIASFSVEAVSEEDAGFAIDNVAFPGDSLMALGDSFSSGEGNPPFSASGGACDQSSQAWPVLLGHEDPNLHIVTDVACSGATSEALTGSFKGQLAQDTQLQDADPQPSLVTLTMGGNDVGFSPILRDCFIYNCVWDHRLREAENAIETEEPILEADYKGVQSADPDATVIVVGYPQLFPSTRAAQTGCHFWLADNERAGLVRLSAMMDLVIQQAAQAAGVKYVQTLGVLAGHELCTDAPWVYPIGFTGGANRGHPTAPGQQAMENAVQNYIDSL